MPHEKIDKFDRGIINTAISIIGIAGLIVLLSLHNEVYFTYLMKHFCMGVTGTIAAFLVTGFFVDELVAIILALFGCILGLCTYGIEQKTQFYIAKHTNELPSFLVYQSTTFGIFMGFVCLIAVSSIFVLIFWTSNTALKKL